MTAWVFFFSGVVFGLSGGLTPGPLLVLVISETLRHGRGAGIRVGLAPLLTDFPIILAAWLVLTRLQDSRPVLGVIALAGSAYLAYLGWESVRYRGTDRATQPLKQNPWIKGVTANLLNPSPYLFWFTVGVPTLIKAASHAWHPAVLFTASFYICLVGAKLALAFATDRSRAVLRSHYFVWIIRGLGIFLWLFALRFLGEGFKYFGLL